MRRSTTLTQELVRLNGGAGLHFTSEGFGFVTFDNGGGSVWAQDLLRRWVYTTAADELVVKIGAASIALSQFMSMRQPHAAKLHVGPNRQELERPTCCWFRVQCGMQLWWSAFNLHSALGLSGQRGRWLDKVWHRWAAHLCELGVDTRCTSDTRNLTRAPPPSQTTTSPMTTRVS